MQALIPEHVARTRWPAERISAERDAGLRRLLRAAADGSPWHRERLAGVTPETFQVKDLRSLPVMNKDDLISHFDDIVTDRAVTVEVIERYLAGLGDRDAYLLESYHASVSGGSSGIRGIFAADWDAWKTYFLALFRYIYRNPDAPMGRNGKPPLVVGLTGSNAGHISSSLRQTFGPRDPLPIGLSVLDPFEKNVDRLNELQPEVLLTYPSMLRPLALHAQEGGRLRIAPKAVISVAEPLLPDLRDLARTTWPETAIFNWYAMSEAGCVAASCGVAPGMHLSEDLVILEAVDADGQPVPPGVRSDKVYVTNLANMLMPIIRYELDDQVTLLPSDEPCACGSHHRRIADIEGRRRETFRYPEDVRVNSVRLSTPLTLDASIIEFQVRQTAAGIAVRLRGTDPNVARVTRDLEAALMDAGLAHPEVTVEVVDLLPRLEISGKLVRFVPLPAEDSVDTPARARD